MRIMVQDVWIDLSITGIGTKDRIVSHRLRGTVTSRLIENGRL